MKTDPNVDRAMERLRDECPHSVLGCTQAECETCAPDILNDLRRGVRRETFLDAAFGVEHEVSKKGDAVTYLRALAEEADS
jgi:hypothetical protein